MNLYLVQHGLALDKSSDPERPLSDEGQADVKKIARFLQRANIKPMQFLHSGKARAQQTAQILATALGDKPANVLENINPNDALDTAAQFIAQSDQDTMLVGHLPFMQRLVSFLLCNNETTGFSYQPGTIICLFRGDNAWSMQWMIRPDLLTTTQQ